MATIEGNIGKLIPGVQSVAVLSRSLDLVPKTNKKGFIGKKPLKSSKKFVKSFMDITVGTSLIKPTADIVSKL